MLARVIVATLGHIDHGKTTLVKALTGLDTDRLPEEKARGMTIDLGYARCELDDGLVAGIVDVPGHEKLLDNMLAGCFAADIGLLVVDIREGIKPQTVEHLQVARLLGLSSLVVALTKCFDVAQDDIACARSQVRALLADEGYGECQIVAVDSVAGSGIEEIRQQLAACAQARIARSVDAPPLLWVDRAFTIKGVGTVATGTLLRGVIHKGDSMTLWTSGRRLRIRGLQEFGTEVMEIRPGSRAAINLANTALTSVYRGALLTGGNVVEMAQSAAIASGWCTLGRVRAYIGTLEVHGRIRRKRIHGIAQTCFVADDSFPLYEGLRALFRAENSRELLGAAKLIPLPKPHCRAREALAATVADTVAAETSIGNVRYSVADMARYLDVLRDIFNKQEWITLAQFRDAAGINREQAKNLLEHFDTQKYTLRTGLARRALHKLFIGR